MNYEDLAKAYALRAVPFDAEKYAKMQENKRELTIATEQLQQQRNSLSKTIGQLKAKNADSSAEMAAMVEINSQLDESKEKLQAQLVELHAFELELPNILDARVPSGVDESANKVIKTWGEPKKFEFKVRDHVDLGAIMNGMDFETAANNSKSRFVYLTGKIASLHRALAQWMLKTHISEHNYLEVYVPLLVNAQALTHTGQLPKFAEDLFFTNDNLGLIPTAEVPLVGMYANQTIKTESLPIKLVAHSACFRSEAGSYGKDTRGMIRQHQFDKVELVQIVHPKQAEAAHQEILAQAELILQRLNLPYRVILKCSGDTGFTASITYDLEVWLPSQNTYREISSISQCTDFQAKRMKCRYKGDDKGFVHTLNGSGLAVGRTLVAVLENYQQADGTVTIPECLQDFLY